jgi:hypothetical protein
MYLLDSDTVHGFAFLTTKQVDRGVVDTIANSDELAAFSTKINIPKPRYEAPGTIR